MKEKTTNTAEAVEPNIVEEEPVAIISANDQAIRNLIYTVRGAQVMLDSDLARLYEVETGNLNKATGERDHGIMDPLKEEEDGNGPPHTAPLGGH